MPTQKHNPTAEERDERIGPFDVDPEEALAAILKVDPESEPVDGHSSKSGTASD